MFKLLFLRYRSLQTMGTFRDNSITGRKCLCVSEKDVLWSKHFDIQNVVLLSYFLFCIVHIFTYSSYFNIFQECFISFHFLFHIFPWVSVLFTLSTYFHICYRFPCFHIFHYVFIFFSLALSLYICIYKKIIYIDVLMYILYIYIRIIILIDF